MLTEALAQPDGRATSSPVKYSICMCNYNMADTLERSLTSILDHVDSRFEVVLVDDGSNDGSADVVTGLQKRYRNLRMIRLARDPSRKLGLTRNISIQEADGEYVMLHLDCDDVFGPYLPDFVEVFHRIERCVGRDVLLSGQHINMAKREFLLGMGPYRNLYRGEDRDLWARLAATDSYVPLRHIDFVTRLPKTRAVRLRKTVVDTLDHMRNDFRGGAGLLQYIRYEIQKQPSFSFRLKVFRWLALLPSWIMSRFDEPLTAEKGIGTAESFASHREAKRGLFSEIMARYGGSGDLSFLRPEARKIFES